MTDLPGVDLDALRSWLDAAHSGLRRGDLAGEVLAGGKSNLTYRITDGTTTWALRRPPLAHVLPTAHDMVREYRVISALADTDVPVPAAVALCDDAGVLGAPFYLMGFVNGIVLDRPEVIAGVPPGAAHAACEQLVDTLVALHAVDPARVGLADFGRPAGFLQRQLGRWHTQWLASQTRPLGQLDEVVQRLTATLPDQSAATIVHGDYRLTNVMYRSGTAGGLDGIAAVVDWEMATLGDPLADLGLHLTYRDPVFDAVLGEAAAATSPRQPAADALAAHYAAVTGRDVGGLSFYLGLGYFKAAIIAAGIHARHVHGHTVGAGFEGAGTAVAPLAAAGLAALRTSDR